MSVVTIYTHERVGTGRGDCNKNGVLTDERDRQGEDGKPPKANGGANLSCSCVSQTHGGGNPAVEAGGKESN